MDTTEVLGAVAGMKSVFTSLFWVPSRGEEVIVLDSKLEAVEERLDGCRAGHVKDREGPNRGEEVRYGVMREEAVWVRSLFCRFGGV